ncbi:MAG: hypothetical protein JO232_03595 [Verrucomicrobia bacterium]|nr:hypothetical protein [Verrucomicrobiota bacterium]
MNPPQVAQTDIRILVAKAFAQQFNHFEWDYLCSHQWFLTGIDRALETGDFSRIQDRAVKTLADDKIRPRWQGKTRAGDFVPWLI